jgi:DNA repair protein RadC
LWRCDDGLFFEVPLSASDALLKTFHSLLKNVLQTVFHKLQEVSGTGTVLGLPLHGLFFTFVSPFFKRFHHLKTAARLIASSP